MRGRLERVKALVPRCTVRIDRAPEQGQGLALTHRKGPRGRIRSTCLETKKPRPNHNRGSVDSNDSVPIHGLPPQVRCVVRGRLPAARPPTLTSASRSHPPRNPAAPARSSAGSRRPHSRRGRVGHRAEVFRAALATAPRRNAPQRITAQPPPRRGSVDQFVPHSGHGISGSATPNPRVAVCNRSCSGGDRPDRWPVARSGASLRRTQTAATAATRIRNNDQH